MSFVRADDNLRVWKKSLALARQIYSVTQDITAPGQDALAAQMRYAATAFASRVAEGSACGNRLEYIRFLRLARRALAELETRVCIASELGLLDAGAPLGRQIAEMSELLAGLLRRLREHRERARSFGSGAPVLRQ